jgi:hypothetical protein
MVTELVFPGNHDPEYAERPPAARTGDGELMMMIARVSCPTCGVRCAVSFNARKTVDYLLDLLAARPMAH